MVRARREQVWRLLGEGAGGDYWEKRAERFRRGVGMAGPGDPVLDLIAKRVLAPARVLDVGAGTGRHAIPLAAMGYRVTAVEPSRAMRQMLLEEAAGRGVELDVVAGEWEEVRVPPAEVVLCSHVLYAVEDARSFLTKLDGHAERLAVVAIRVDPWPHEALFGLVWGEPREPEPAFSELYNLLLELGIAANVRIYRRGDLVYPDVESALEDWASRLWIAPEDPRRVALARALEEALVPGEGGFTVGGERRWALIWWEKEIPLG